MIKPQERVQNMINELTLMRWEFSLNTPGQNTIKEQINKAIAELDKLRKQLVG